MKDIMLAKSEGRIGQRLMMALLLLTFSLTPLVTQAEMQNQAQPQTQNSPPAAATKVGKVVFPGAFIHGAKEYTGGAYQLFLTEKDGWPYFQVYSLKNELLLEEMAVVLSPKGKRSSHLPRRGLTSDKKYFCIKVVREGKTVLGFFLLKPASTEPAAPQK